MKVQNILKLRVYQSITLNLHQVEGVQACEPNTIQSWPLGIRIERVVDGGDCYYNLYLGGVYQTSVGQENVREFLLDRSETTCIKNTTEATTVKKGRPFKVKDEAAISA